MKRQMKPKKDQLPVASAVLHTTVYVLGSTVQTQLHIRSSADAVSPFWRGLDVRVKKKKGGG